MTLPASAPQPRYAAGESRVHIIQGEFYVSADPSVMLTTTLGSCVAACIRDPEAGVGGMNHFLLPGDGGEIGQEAARYGAYAMELLINALLQAGASRGRLDAKLFGGGHLVNRLLDIGEQNATFAEGFLRREGIRVSGGSTRGEHARRIQFWPVSGRARQLALVRGEEQVFAKEHPLLSRVPIDRGSVELF